jgi:membrane fusion protein (multidrug efflux system)
VKKGSLLYVIEQAPYLARVASNQAQVEQAKADLFKAEQKLNRLLSAQPESIPATDLDDAKAQKDYAEGLLKESQANLKLALIDLDYTTITAPITGRIGKTRYTEGNYVNTSSDALAVIHQLNPIRVVFSLGENKVHHLQNSLRDMKENNKVNFINPEIYFSDGSKYNKNGLIDFIDNSVDPSTGTIAVWAIFENQEYKLIPGEYVTIYLTLDKPDLKVLVPLEAVQMDNEGSFVFTVNKNNIVEERRIITGKQLEDKWIVKSGLKESECVIVQGIQKIRPGIKVKTSSIDVEENH